MEPEVGEEALDVMVLKSLAATSCHSNFSVNTSEYIYASDRLRGC